jgi:hypothetical protein
MKLKFNYLPRAKSAAAFVGLALTAGPLSGCVGETRAEALGQCQIGYLSLPIEQRPRDEWKYVAPCMEGRGFTLSTGELCLAAANIGISTACYEPRGLANSIRYYLGV